MLVHTMETGTYSERASVRDLETRLAPVRANQNV